MIQKENKKINETQKKLADEIGISNLPEEKQQALMVKMTEALLKKIFLDTIDKLNPGDQEKYQKMIDENKKPQEIESFVREKITDYDKMVERIVMDFKKEIKSDNANSLK